MVIIFDNALHLEFVSRNKKDFNLLNWRKKIRNRDFIIFD